MHFVGLGYGYFMKTKKSIEGFVSVTVTSAHSQTSSGSPVISASYFQQERMNKKDKCLKNADKYKPFSDLQL